MEKEMATHSSILPWKTPWTEEPGEFWSMGFALTECENLRKAGKERRENYSELLGLRPTLSSQSGEIKRGQIGQDVLPTLHGTH